MTVSPCEAVINLRGRWFGGDGAGPSRGRLRLHFMWRRRNASDIPAGNKSHMALQRRPWKRKKAQPAAESSQLCAVCMAGDKNGHGQAGNSRAFMLPPVATESGRAPGPGSQHPAAAPGRGSQGEGLIPFPGAGPEPPQMSHRQDPLPARPGTPAVTQGPALRRVPCSFERAAIPALNVLRRFEQGTCSFVFALGPPKLHNRLPHQPRTTGLLPLPRARAWG